MKILVCISKTPDTTAKIAFANGGKKFEEAGVQWIINPYDEWYALVRAIELKEKDPATIIHLITVGGADAEPIIRKALALGGDEAIRINTDSSDSYYIAAQIAEVANTEKYDLVFTSPPFYTKEVYNNMIEWKSVKEFMTEFLKPLIKKSAKYLLQNGHLVLYIEDTNTEEFIPLMKEYALTQDLFYEGAFYYEGSGGTLKPYYVWLKK